MSAVLVDLDGTLVDSAPDIAAAVNAMLADLGEPALPLATIVGFIGNGVPTLVQRVLAAGAITAEGDAVAVFQRHYDATNGRLSRVFPGVSKSLASLRAAGHRLACVTNKPHHATTTLLALTGLAPWFDAVVGGDTTPFLKPHPAPLLHACALLHTDTRNAVLVGDSHVDVAAARAAGMPVYIVRYGYPGAGSLNGATFIDTLADLPALLAPQKVIGTKVPHSPPS